MFRIEKINGKNVWEILKLRVSESQKEFVAANDVSIIEAYTTITANGFAFPFGIYDSKTPVGFMMIGYDSADYWEDAPDIARGNYSLWRLMIDENYQKKDLVGKQLLLDWISLNHFLVVSLSTAGFLMNRRMKLPVSCIVRLDLLKLEIKLEEKSLLYWNFKTDEINRNLLRRVPWQWMMTKSWEILIWNNIQMELKKHVYPAQKLKIC